MNTLLAPKMKHWVHISEHEHFSVNFVKDSNIQPLLGIKQSIMMAYCPHNYTAKFI
jgi:hypothetical protein